jgi:hypothetical protein
MVRLGSFCFKGSSAQSPEPRTFETLGRQQCFCREEMSAANEIYPVALARFLPEAIAELAPSSRLRQDDSRLEIQ